MPASIVFEGIKNGQIGFTVYVHFQPVLPQGSTPIDEPYFGTFQYRYKYVYLMYRER